MLGRSHAGTGVRDAGVAFFFRRDIQHEIRAMVATGGGANRQYVFMGFGISSYPK
jgi:hypothetical protein